MASGSYKVLIVGGGGREHALAWKCAQSPRVTEVLVAPGNAGTAREPKVRNVPLGADELQKLADFAAAEQVALTIVGPEGPLVAGITDLFRQRGLPCFGPSQAAARLEGSKAFTKEFLQRHGIPTAGYRKFTRGNFDAQWLAVQKTPIVVKASGLAAGKGVIIAQTTEEAVAAAESMLQGRFGSAGDEIVIEEFLDGEEASFIVISDGTHVLPMASSQDHKRLRDGDAGPNTGGMGAYSPAPVVTPAVHARIMREVIEPTIRGLAADGMPFVGFLYAGLMIDAGGAPKVIEYNVRFGDPETQPVLARLHSDLTVLCEAALAGRLNTVDAAWDPRAALGVVMAAQGYPDEVRKGDVIHGLEAAAALPGKLFHAGTAERNGTVVTAGGRVLCAVGLGTTVQSAQHQAYALVDTVRFDGAQVRRDIGYRAIARERTGIQVRRAAFDNPADAAAIVQLLNHYASDPRGGGVPLSDAVRGRLVAGLAAHPMSCAWLAFDGNAAVGLCVGFIGYSTFRALPLLNVHDVSVLATHRGKGIGHALLAAAEQHARELGCCKLTLEVQDDNTPAQRLYAHFGFEDVRYGDSGPTRFLAKTLS